MQKPRSISGLDRGLSDSFVRKIEIKMTDVQGLPGLVQRQCRDLIDRLQGEAGRAVVKILGGEQPLEESVFRRAIGFHVLQQVVDVATHARQLQSFCKFF